MIESIIKDIEEKQNVVILGFGKEGRSTYNLIRKYLPEKKLTIKDGNINIIENNIDLKSDNNLLFDLGEDYLNNLDKYDMIIKAPGVNFKYIDYSTFEDKITSQVDLFFKYSNIKTIGVTGTKGKSTTSSLIDYILKEMGLKSILAGNIGIPVFETLHEIDKDTIAVIELSCHQLKFCKHSPNISVLLNLYEEHLDLYKSKKDYMQSKLNIFKYQKEDDYKVYGLNSIDSYKYFKNSKNTFVFSGNKDDVEKGIVINSNGLLLNDNIIYSKNRKRNLIGDHNLNNIAAAILVANILNLNLLKVVEIIDNFMPLEHRMEKVGTFKGITFYNDSIATIPSATINCIKTIDNLKTIIIGGMDRGLDLSELVDYLLYIDKKIETCIFLKDTGYKIYDELKKKGYSKKIFKAYDMKDAVRLAFLNTSVNSCCALSPAAASYNVYKNFEMRGKDFKDNILLYKE